MRQGGDPQPFSTMTIIVGNDTHSCTSLEPDLDELLPSSGGRNQSTNNNHQDS